MFVFRVLLRWRFALPSTQESRRAVEVTSRKVGIALSLLLCIGLTYTSLPADLTNSGASVFFSSFLPKARAESVSPIFLPAIYRGYPPDYSPPASIFGVQMEAAIDDANGLQRANQSGAKWLRMTLLWSDIEHNNTEPRTYDWSKYDPMFVNASRAGVTPIVVVRGNPRWASTTSSGPIDLVPLSRYTEFLANLVSRYKNAPYNVKYWELYNEPDNSQTRFDYNGGLWGNNGKEYADMLRVAYPAIKSADSQAQVLLGSLAYDWFTTDCDADGKCGPFVKSFLDDVLSNGGGQYFDIMNFHYYLVFGPLWDPYGKDIIGKTNYLRNKLAQYGISRPIICSEVGMWSSPPDGSAQLQSDYVFQVYARSMAADLKSVIWFTLVDSGGGAKRGLLDSSLTPKPSYNVYKAISAQLDRLAYKGTSSSVYGTTSDVEGYVFTSADGKTKKTILWLNGDTISRTIAFPASQVTIVDSGGNLSFVADGAAGDLDGQPNGKVTVQVTKSPVLVGTGP